MEIHKLSNCDYFIYTQLSELTVSSNNDTYSSGSGIYLNGVALPDCSGTVIPFQATVHVHFSLTKHGDRAINDSVTITESGHSYKIDSYAGDEPEFYAANRYDKNVDNTSYQILRVNPKLTGNIKVVVDSSSRMYLDTFKVSQGLSQQKYRKIHLNPNEYYGRTLMTKLNGLPSDDLYKIEDSCYELFASCSTLEDQYYDIYNSGVRTNNDHMYSENFAILAPLKIRKILPDFFLVFKIKNYNTIQTNPERIKYFMENGEIVKVFDLRAGTDIGKYIRNIYDHAKGFVGDIYTSYDYDSFNIYNGISLERGVVSNIYEATSLERQLKNQTAMNDWYTLGFQRNRIVSKDIINFEFMFDDLSEKLFSLNTYFGVYVKLNGEKENFSVIGVSQSNNPIFDSSILLRPEFNPSSDSNKDIIYGLSTPETFIRMDSNIQSADAISTLQDFILKPYRCIYTSNVQKSTDTSHRHHYVTFTLLKPLLPGEIFRIIQTSGERQILQIVCSNYVDSETSTSEIISETSTISNNEYTISSTSIFNISYNYDDQRAAIKNQIVEVKAAFEKMFTETGFNGRCNILNDDTLAIEVFSENDVSEGSLYFQKFISNCGFDNIQVNVNTDERISFFGKTNLPTTEMSPDQQSVIPLYPNGFESLGNRVSTTIKFISAQNLIGLENNPSEKISAYKTIIYPKRTVNGDIEYDVIGDITITVISGDSQHTIVENSIMSYDPNFPYMMNVGDYPYETLYLYQNYPLNAGICSILSVKDFYTDVIDTINRISINPQETKISDIPGEYQSEKNAANVAISSGSEESICDYIDKNESIADRELDDDSKVNTFLKNNIAINHTKSDISLVSSYCCKWQSVGTNHIGRPIRVMFPYKGDNIGMSSGLIDSDSYFLANIDSSTFVGFISTEWNRLPYNARFDSYTTEDNGIWKTLNDAQITLNGDYATLKLKFHDADNVQNRIVIIDPNFSDLFTRGYTTGVSFYARINPDEDYDEASIVTAMASGGVWRSVISHDITKHWKKIEISCPYPYTTYDPSTGQFCFQHKDERIEDKYLVCDVKDISFHINSDSEYDKYVNSYLSRMNHFDFREHLLYGDGKIDDVIYSPISKKPKFSKIYKYGNDSIEFVSGGLKIRISSSSRSTIDLSKYNGYSGIIICMDGSNPSNNTPCEIIIDETCEQIAFVIYNGLSVNQMSYPGENSNQYLNKYYEIYHSSPISDTLIGIDSSGIFVISIPDNAGFYDDTILSEGSGLFVQSSPSIDNMSFDRDKNIELITKTDTSLFYDNAYPNYINTIYDNDIKFLVDSSGLTPPITSQIIKNISYKHKYLNNCFIYSPDTPQKMNNLKYGDDAFRVDKIKSIINDFTLIIKNDRGLNDYSGQSNIISVEVIDPIMFDREANDLPYGTKTTSGIVHPTYAEPVMVDVLDFDFENTSVLKDSSIACNGCNIRVSDVYNIRQTWLRKFLTPGGSLVKNNGDDTFRTTSISLLKDINPIANCWEQDMFRIFSNDDTYTSKNGIDTGYEKNTFFSSRGLTLKSRRDSSTTIDFVVLTDWINTVIDRASNTITLNITDTLVNKILSEEGYTENWNNVESEDINMSKYIENSIIKYFEINNYTKFIVGCDYISNVFSLLPTNESSKYDIVTNIENELIFVDNKYYMIIKNLENHIYYASMIIPTM